MAQTYQGPLAAGVTKNKIAQYLILETYFLARHTQSLLPTNMFCCWTDLHGNLSSGNFGLHGGLGGA